MYTQKLLLLAAITLAIAAAYFTHVFWKSKINPRQSAAHFLLYLAVHLATIFVLVFIFGFIIIQCKEFFFKK